MVSLRDIFLVVASVAGLSWGVGAALSECDTVLVTNGLAATIGRFESPKNAVYTVLQDSDGGKWAGKPYWVKTASPAKRQPIMYLYAVLGEAWRISTTLGVRDLKDRILATQTGNFALPTSGQRGSWDNAEMVLTCMSSIEDCEAPEAGEGCIPKVPVITVMGHAGSKKEINGVYHFLKSNKDPWDDVYMKSTGDKFISYNTNNQWIFTNKEGINTNSGYAFAQVPHGTYIHEIANKVYAPAAWQVSSADNKWEFDSKLKVVMQHIFSVRIEGRKGHTEILNGKYSPTGEMSHGSHVYKREHVKEDARRETTDVYLHWHSMKNQKGSSGRWMLSPLKEVGTNSGWSFKIDKEGIDPVTATTDWEIATDGVWSHDRNMRIFEV